ncbi:hypothetical protein C8J57DRAFT_1245906 [Mycena rebaudengoi]|nr:hypothetical protein C8J57DRAFT_1245906 [Mycena rebaudengoi]
MRKRAKTTGRGEKVGGERSRALDSPNLRTRLENAGLSSPTSSVPGSPTRGRMTHPDELIDFVPPHDSFSERGKRHQAQRVLALTRACAALAGALAYRLYPSLRRVALALDGGYELELDREDCALGAFGCAKEARGEAVVGEEREAAVFHRRSCRGGGPGPRTGSTDRPPSLLLVVAFEVGRWQAIGY